MMMAEGKAGGGAAWQDCIVAPDRIEWPEGGPLSCLLGRGSYGMVCRVGLAAAAAGDDPLQQVALKIPTILRDPAREPRLDNAYWPLARDERQRQQEMWHSEIDLLARAQGSPYVTRLVGVVLTSARATPSLS